MVKRLVLVGGGHAHMTVLLRLGEITGSGHQVVLVSPSPYHYYSGMGPGLLSGIYEPRQVRFNIRKMAEARGAAFIREEAVRVDPVGRMITLTSGRELPYDVASFNTGSRVPAGPLAGEADAVVPVKPIANLLHARQELITALAERDLRLVVVGGGAAGVEIAGNLWRLCQKRPHRAAIHLVGGDRILRRFPARVRELALDSLQQRGIEVREGVRVTAAADSTLILSDATKLGFDLVFWAAGVEPSPLFTASGLPTGTDGGLLVNEYLQNTAHPELFGGGDCIALADTPLAKVGVYAVRQNPVLLHNLRAALEGEALQPFRDSGDYLLALNLGDGTGIAWKHGWVWDGRFAFRLKDYIDRRFMRKFQVSGELAESNADG